MEEGLAVAPVVLILRLWASVAIDENRKPVKKTDIFKLQGN